MLVKYIVRYAPSVLLPAFSAFGALFCYTRLLTPEQFGEYALVMNWTNLVTVAAFTWVLASLPRLLPQAARQNNALSLSTTGYAAFVVLAIILAAIALICAPLITSPEVRKIVLLSMLLAFVRGLHGMNLLIHRNALDTLGYAFLECGQSVLGLLSGLMLVYFWHLGSIGAICGLIIGPALTWAADWRTTRRSIGGKLDIAMLKDMLVFGIPLVFSSGFTFILAASDRFFLEYFCGNSAVGLYSAGYNLMERTMSIICMLAVIPSYTIIVHALEHKNAEAARQEIYHSGVALFALLFPACAGVILIREPLASFIMGSAFRADALLIMPWIAIGALLGNIATHYFNLAFNFSKKSYLLIAVQGPAAAISIVSNLILIPRFGIMGSAYSAVLSFVALCVFSIVIGKRAFPIPIPYKPTLHICLSVLAMTVAVLLLPAAHSIAGMILMIVVGGGVYSAGLLTFNVLDLRTHVLHVVTRIRGRLV